MRATFPASGTRSCFGISLSWDGTNVPEHRSVGLKLFCSAQDRNQG